jgi:cell division protease FtsH
LIWIIIGLILISLFNLFSGSVRGPEVQLAYSEFLAKVKVGEVNDVMVKGMRFMGISQTEEPLLRIRPTTLILSRS